MSKRFSRADQLLVSLGYGNRKSIQRLIKDERIQRTDGLKLKEDDRIDPELIRYLGEPLDHPYGIMILMNKPLGVVCSHNKDEGKLIYDLLPERWRGRDPKLTTVGRLDKDTSGLIILTDQSQWVHQWTSPRNHVTKVYEATLRDRVDESVVDLFASGNLVLAGEQKACLPAELTIIEEKKVRLKLTEGKYHQVRRMFAATDNFVETLHRTHFGQLNLEGLQLGEYRSIKASEVGE
jgi:16S rRNA pseudouridine516 synthase